MKNIQRILIGFFMICCFVFISQNADAMVEYTIEFIAQGGAHGINDSGQVVGTCPESMSCYHWLLFC